MTAILFPRKLNQLNDVISAGILPGDVPTWDGASFSMAAGGGGGGGSFSLGVSDLGNTLGQTGITGSRIVLAGIGNITLSQSTNVSGGTISISGAGGGADFSMGVSGGNTAGDTGATGTRVVLAGGNGITLSQATDANGGTITVSGITQSAQTQDRFDLTLDGNTAGALQLVSSGTLTLAGGANITLSQNGNAITISGAAGETQTAISGLANSQTTYTSGTVSLSELGAITIRSTTGNQFQFSVNPQSVQPETQTFIAGLAASNTTYTSGTVTIVGSGNITVASTTGQRIIISGSQSVQAETQTFVGGVAASNTTYTSGTLTITGVGGGVTVSSNTGQRIDISVAAQSVQTQNVHNVTLSGNTAGAMAQVSSGTMTLAGGNNITLSQAGNAITISGANLGGAQTGISGIAASNTTYTSGSVTFTGVGGGVTVSSNTGQRVDISVAAPVAQTNQAGSLFAVGNTTSSSSGTYDARTLSLRGDGMISIAATNSGFRISATQSNQAGSLFAVGNTTSSSSGTFDARSMSIRGDGIISIAATNSGWRISATESVQTQNVHNVTLSGNTSGVMAQISSGTMTLAGGNNITLSQAGNAITISGANVGGAQTGISGLANSQTTYTSGTVSLSELGAITIRSTTGNQFQFSVDPQSVQSLGMYALGNTTGQSSSTTFDARTVSLRGDGIISLGYSGGSLRISASQSVQPETQTAISGIANSQTTYTSGTVSLSELGAITIRSTTGNQFQFSVNAQTGTQFSAGLSNIGNTAGDTVTVGGRLILAGGNGITLSGSSNGVSQTITISGITQSVQTQGQFSAGVSNVGNTAGDTGVTGTRLVFVGSNNITLSQATAAAGGTVTISGPTTAAQTNQAGSVYAVGNTTSSSSGTYDARTLSIRGDGIISVAATNSGWRISATESVQTQNLHNVTLSGNTAGVMAQISSGTMTLAGGNGITLSQNANAVTISGVTQSVQPGVQHFVVSNTTFSSGTVSISGFGDVTVNTAANIIRISAPVQTAETAISGIANSQTTYTSGTVSLSELGAITIRSTTGNQYQFSVNSQTVQTQNLHNVTLSGNTAGVMAQISSGTLTLAGGANITLSQAGNAVTISGGGGTSSDTDVTAITQSGHGFAVGDWVRLSGTSYVKAQADSEANAEVVGVVSAVADVNNFTLTTGGLVTGLSGLTAGAVYYLDPSTAGAITSTEPTAIGEISKPVLIARSTTSGYVFNMRGYIVPSTAAAAGFSAGVSNIGNTLGDTGVTGTRLVLAGTDNITLSQSTDANGATVRISGPSPSGGGFSGGVSNLGNTAGDTGVTGTRLVFAGGNSITLSQATNANGGTVTISGPTQTNDSGGVYAVGNTYSTSSGTYDVRSLSIRGDGIISIAASNSGWRISASQSVQAETQTFVAGIAASNTTYTSGTITITGVGGGVTVSSNTGQRVDISVAAPVAQTNQSGGVYAVGNTYSSSSGTIDARTISLRGDGIISVAATNSGWRISAAAQTGISSIVASDTTYTSGSVQFTGSNMVTVRSSANQRVVIDATQSVQTQNMVAVTLSGNTAGAMAQISSGTLTLAGGNNITLSQAGNAVTISGGAGGGFSAGLSNLGNTQGQTGVTGTRLVIVGTNNITLSQATDANGGTISISGQSPAGGAFSAGASNLGNTAGATGISGTQMVLVGSGVMSLSQTTGANGNTLSILAPAQSVLSAVAPLSTSTNGSTISFLGPATSSLVGVSGVSVSTNGSTISIMETSGGLFVQELNPYLYAAQTFGQQGQGTLHIQPMQVHPDLRMDRVLIGGAISNATNSSFSITITNIVGIYTRNASSLSLLTSASTSTNFTGSGTAGSYSLYGGRRWQSIPLTTTLSEGDYYIAIGHRSTTGGGAGHSVSQILMTQQSNATFSGWSGLLGAATNATMQHVLGMGVYTASTLSAPASIGLTQINGSGTLAMMPPVYALRSGTV